MNDDYISRCQIRFPPRHRKIIKNNFLPCKYEDTAPTLITVIKNQTERQHQRSATLANLTLNHYTHKDASRNLYITWTESTINLNDEQTTFTVRHTNNGTHTGMSYPTTYTVSTYRRIMSLRRRHQRVKDITACYMPRRDKKRKQKLLQRIENEVPTPQAEKEKAIQLLYNTYIEPTLFSTTIREGYDA